MLLVVKILNGSEHSVDVSPDISIQELKNVLTNELKIPANQQRLMFKGKALTDTHFLKDYSIESGAKLNLMIKKDNESNLTKQLKSISKPFVTDVDEFATIFNKELKKLVNEMSLDDIERYDELKASLNNVN